MIQINFAMLPNSSHICCTVMPFRGRWVLRSSWLWYSVSHSVFLEPDAAFLMIYEFSHMLWIFKMYFYQIKFLSFSLKYIYKLIEFGNGCASLSGLLRMCIVTNKTQNYRLSFVFCFGNSNFYHRHHLICYRHFAWTLTTSLVLWSHCEKRLKKHR